MDERHGAGHGIQALGRAAAALERPEIRGHRAARARRLHAARRRGVRTTGPRGGIALPPVLVRARLYIFNAFLQSLIGLYDFSNLANDARARRLYDGAVEEGRAEVPLSDVGDWSRYSYAGAESTADYHELLREFLASLCSRRQGAVFCEYARKYRGYQVDPPEIDLPGPGHRDRGPAGFAPVQPLEALGRPGDGRGGRTGASCSTGWRRSAAAAARSRGRHAARRPSPYGVAAKELRTGLGKRDSDTAEIVVENRPG